MCPKMPNFIPLFKIAIPVIGFVIGMVFVRQIITT